jgi:CYTH domain-containing protein
MNKTAKTEIARIFLIEDLPEPLTRASGHIQIFDNYVENTSLRLRSIRVPETKAWTRILQQRHSSPDGDARFWKVAEIYLSETEYTLFEQFEGREIRKNRYFHEYGGKMFAFDVFLGRLWGLNMAKIEFESHEDAARFEPPSFAVFEVTTDPFFEGENLVAKRFDDVRDEVAKVGAAEQVVTEMPDA